MKTFLKHFNGWSLLIAAIILFFVSPNIYRLVDPTAGNFDAGYLHAAVYGIIVVALAIVFSLGALALIAPGIYKDFDQYLDGRLPELSDRVLIGLIIMFVMFVGVVIVVAAAV